MGFGSCAAFCFLDHDPILAQALGNMVVAWARAETAFLHTYAAILFHNFNEAMAAYWQISTFEARTKVLIAMLSHWQTRDYDVPAIARAVTKLAKLAKTRNKWVHSSYALEPQATQTVIYDYRAPEGTPERRQPIKLADIQHHIQTVRRRTEELEKLVKIHWRPDVRLT